MKTYNVTLEVPQGGTRKQILNALEKTDFYKDFKFVKNQSSPPGVARSRVFYTTVKPESIEKLKTFIGDFKDVTVYSNIEESKAMNTKYVKLFEDFEMNESSKTDQFVLITHNWNPYLVKASDMDSRPRSEDFQGKTTDEWANKIAEAGKAWINRIEHYYVTPELQKEWGWESGWGSKTKDVTKLFKGVDFEVKDAKTIEHVKIARGAKTVDINGKVAVPINKK
jgi:hypothetical protein